MPGTSASPARESTRRRAARGSPAGRRLRCPRRRCRPGPRGRGPAPRRGCAVLLGVAHQVLEHLLQTVGVGQDGPAVLDVDAHAITVCQDPLDDRPGVDQLRAGSRPCRVAPGPSTRRSAVIWSSSRVCRSSVDNNRPRRSVSRDSAEAWIDSTMPINTVTGLRISCAVVAIARDAARSSLGLEVAGPRPSAPVTVAGGSPWSSSASVEGPVRGGPRVAAAGAGRGGTADQPRGAHGGLAPGAGRASTRAGSSRRSPRTYLA